MKGIHVNSESLCNSLFKQVLDEVSVEQMNSICSTITKCKVESELYCMEPLTMYTIVDCNSEYQG